MFKVELIPEPRFNVADILGSLVANHAGQSSSGSGVSQRTANSNAGKTHPLPPLLLKNEILKLWSQTFSIIGLKIIVRCFNKVSTKDNVSLFQ